METTLHRQLKEVYADESSAIEVPVGSYRIDVVRDDTLIEIQHASLASIRSKIERLVCDHEVLVVKPIVVRRQLVKLSRKRGRVVGRRLSPKRGRLLDVFHELIYFTHLFPHPNLTIEVPLIDIAEWRYPGHGRRRRWRKRDYQVQDQELISIHEKYKFRQACDLKNVVTGDLPKRFDTSHLAKALDVDRWFAQRVAYCFRKMGAAQQVGKRGNALLYEFPTRKR